MVIRHSPQGFTLIESLTVVSIIGILAATSVYVYTSASSRSRDARRKSDLTAVSLSFQARYDNQTCSDATAIGYYPGHTLNWGGHTDLWKPITVLRNGSDDCGAFSEYLITIPTDPKEGRGGLPYLFNLSNQGVIIGKHYRLTTKLEKPQNTAEKAALVRTLDIWQNSFGGAVLPNDYNYIIGN